MLSVDGRNIMEEGSTLDSEMPYASITKTLAGSIEPTRMLDATESTYVLRSGGGGVCLPALRITSECLVAVPSDCSRSFSTPDTPSVPKTRVYFMLHTANKVLLVRGGHVQHVHRCVPNAISYDRIDHLIMAETKCRCAADECTVEHNTGATNATWPCTQNVSQHFTAVSLACQPEQGR